MIMRIRLDGLRAIAPTSRHYNLPTGPGCSRWFSCTCCRATPIKPIPKPKDCSYNQFKLTRASELPLPPPLPYDPKSIPFQRHIQILTLAVHSSDPDDAWNTYLGIHDSLRRHVPDGLYRSLLERQFEVGDLGERWKRLESLLSFAKECEMNLGDLGLKCLEECLIVGLEFELVREKGLRNKLGLLQELWDVLGGLSSVSPRVRKLWLRVLVRKQRAGGRLSTMRTRELGSLLNQLADQGLTGDIGDIAGEILSMGRNETLEEQVVNLKRVAQYLRKGGWIHKRQIESRMGNLYRAAAKVELSGGEMRIPFIDKVFKEIMEDLDGYALAFFQHGLIYLRRRFPQVGTNVKVIGWQKRAPIQSIVTTVMTLLNEQHVRRDINNLYTAMDVFVAGLSADEDYEPLIEGFVRRFHKLAGEETLGLGERVREFAKVIIQHGLLENTSTSVLSSLLDVIIRTIQPSIHDILRGAQPLDGVHSLIRDIYRALRANSPSHKWTPHNHRQWRLLFYLALHARQLDLASRLYADLHADGMTISPSDSLAMIRGVINAPLPIRTILLERHFLDHYYAFPKIRSTLLLSVIEGLCKTHRANDPGLAYAIAIRIPEIKLGIRHMGPIAQALTARQSFPHAIEVARSLDPTTPKDQVLGLYNKILSQLVTCSPRLLAKKKLDRVKVLELAFLIRRDVAQRGIQPDGTMISCLMRVLAINGYLDQALGMGMSAMKGGMMLGNGVEVLVRRLVDAGRWFEAERLVHSWRERERERDVSDQGVGARIEAIMQEREEESQTEGLEATG